MRTLANPIFVCVALTWASCAIAEDFVRIQGAVCTTPPVLHCPDSECSSATVINQGPVVEMKSRRTYFLDYPCDLKPNEKVTLVLSLHGGGSYGNWQRHYFPIMDYKDKYRLVIATPNSPIRVWTDADDQYLRDIVEFTIGQLGKDNIKSFWLVGHSQGGMTSNRILRSDFFASKVDGWLSLSGGRLGGNPGRSQTFTPGTPSSAAAALPAASTQAMSSMFAQAAKLLTEMPANDISFIYSTGEREVDEKGVPQTSDVATKLSCGARQPARDVVDSRAGYVYDSSRLNQMRPGWGLLPAAGTSQVFAFPNCKDGRVVADVVRLQKGHTEGLEPAITEELVKLIVSAPGGRIQHGG